LVQSLTAILQGLGRPFVSVKNLFIGAVIKVALTYMLTGIKWINVRGAAISTVFAYLIASLLNLLSVKKYTRIKINVKEIFIKPMVSTLGMTIAARLTYLSALNFVEDRLATMVAIIVAAGAYGILLLVTKTLTYDDFSLLPKGEKIADKLVKLKLINR